MGAIMYSTDEQEQLQELAYDAFKDENNIFKVTDVYAKDEIPCAILLNYSEEKT